MADITYRPFDDIPGQRQAIFDYAKNALSNHAIENATHRLELADVGYDDDVDEYDDLGNVRKVNGYRPSLAEEKEHILKRKSLQRALKATVRVIDKTTGQVVGEQRQTVAHVPYLNSRGLFIRNGVAWAMRNQARLRPGAYTRWKQDGGVETHFNTKPGTGASFRIQLEPETGLFKFVTGQSSTRLYPLLRKLGVQDDQIKQSWGEDLFNKNFRPAGDNDTADLQKVLGKMGRRGLVIPDEDAPQALKDVLARAELDEETTQATLGAPHKNVTVDTLLQAANKVLRVARDEDKEDNRDSQAFQSIHSTEDFISERLKKDPTRALHTLLWKASVQKKLPSITPGFLNKNIGAIFEGTGLAMTPEDTNSFEIHDLRQSVTRMGEGGMPADSVSKDARGIQSSYLGVIDPSKAPESASIGLDMRVTDAALKGSDNKLYTKVVSTLTGEPEIVSAKTLSSKVVAFPGQDLKSQKRVLAVTGDTIDYVDARHVDYQIPDSTGLFSRSTAMVPFANSMKGQRLLMGSRFVSQSLPLEKPEAPFVRAGIGAGTDLYQEMGKVAGAQYAPAEGVVTAVTPDYIEVSGPQGKQRVDLYNNYALSRKTMIHNTPIVQVGDSVTKDQLLAKSNLTDDKGVAAFGLNVRVAYMAAKGATHEDSHVISESLAKKFAHEAMYKHDLDLDDVKTTNKADYVALYGDKFTPQQLSSVDDDGVVLPGTKVNFGDPIILGIGEKKHKAVGAVMETEKSTVSDRSQTWEKEAPGVVTDVVKTKNGLVVTIKSYDMAKASDKLSNLFGGKGVISKVVPDSEMPIAADGKPVEAIFNSFGIVSRGNPAALITALLGKVVAKTGKPYVAVPFQHEDAMKFALDEAEKHGVITRDANGKLKDTEDVYDPVSGKTIKNVFVGVPYIVKLHHLAEAKMDARDVGGYTAEGAPAKGGGGNAKRQGVLDYLVLTAAGATNYIKDSKLVRGQRNDDYWRAVKQGEQPILPTVNFANDAFKKQLTAAGVNLRESGTKTQLAPLLDEDVDKLAGHEVESGDTFDFESMKPIKGGLFDIEKTGGAGGTRFAKITLPVAIPHPLFAEPIARILGLTGVKLDKVLAGEESINNRSGPDAIKHELEQVNVDREIERAKQEIRSGRTSLRDAAVRRLNYLTGLKTMNVAPAQLMVTKIPVIPPKFRPVTSGKVDMIHDLNYLYHDLLEARKNYNEAVTEFGSAPEEYRTLWNAVKAVVGLHDPINQKTHELGVKGILRNAIGIGNSPKYGQFQRKVMGNSVDAVGRGVITADPDLDMDSIGVPKNMAWDIFKPYIIRKLVRNGLPAKEAVTAVRERKPVADKALQEVVKEEPIVYNRAPALHKFNYVGGWAKLRDDNAIGLPYYNLVGLAADHDGDAINLHVPSTPEAKQDAVTKLLPSKNLVAPSDFQPRLLPSQDFLAGLYLYTTPKAEPEVVFSSEEEAMAAFKAGKISARTPIKILNPTQLSLG